MPRLAWTLHRIATGRGTRRTLAVGAIAILVLLLSNYTAPVYLIFPLFLLSFLYLTVGALLRRQHLPWPTIRPAFYTAVEILHYSTDLRAFATLFPATPWTKFAENPESGWLIGVEGVAYLLNHSLVAKLSSGCIR